MYSRRCEHVVVGVCGSSMATIVPEIINFLTSEVCPGGTLSVIATPAAAKFTPRLRVPVYTDRRWRRRPLHVGLTDGADLFVIAPATANTICKVALGLADNLLTTSVLASDAPLVMFPAMNVRMWRRPSMARAVELLRADGHHVVEPIDCWSASSDRLGDAVGFDMDYFQHVIDQLLAEGREPHDR